MHNTQKYLYFIILILCITLSLVLSLISPRSLQAAQDNPTDRFFDIQSLDTMKYSRDAARNSQVTKQIPQLVRQLSTMGATHIAIGTPYDEEFYPVMKTWVDEIRKNHMKVWFRGNFSSWEGWFEYPKFSDPFEHIQKTSQYITSHPELFEQGDIFTPAPEPENGGVGDPRTGDNIRQRFFEFLHRSYSECTNAFAQIGKPIRCGYYSVNGDVAKLFTRADVEQTGGVLVIDHYVASPAQLIEDAQALHNKVQAPIILGEFGLPIPDIHGTLTEDQQAQQLKQNLDELMKHSSVIQGMNYWTMYGGSTMLFDATNTHPRKGVQVLRDAFSPYVIYGVLKDEYQQPVSQAELTVNDWVHTTTLNDGSYRLILPPGARLLTVKKEGYATKRIRVDNLGLNKKVAFNLVIAKGNKTLIDYINQILHLLFNR